MNRLQWIPMIATLALIYLLRWMHIGITNFKVFVLIIVVWSLLLILFYSHTRTGQAQDRGANESLEAGLSAED